MATFIRVNLLIISIILFEFVWLYAAKAEETIDYECPSVPIAALNSGYSVEAADKNLWKLSTEDDGVFYIAVNARFCTYEMSAKVLDSDENLNELINTWHKNKMMGTIYKDDQGYIFKHFAVLPDASEQLLEINIGLFDTGASNLLDSIDNYFKEISLENEEETNDNWFKAYIEACLNSDSDCEVFEDTYGPYETY
ncbi:hypothetical protein OAW28_06595, partial [Alphaproteobacteria bacterium]|nr:hypothetical protein [Alphaproteobacteria bacterium]